MMRWLRRIGLFALSMWGASVASAEPGVDYDGQVAPLFRKYCNGCHNTDDPQGALVTEDHALLLEGGSRGPALVAGKSAESRLIQMIEGSAKPIMPPKDNPRPTAEEIAVLKAWIDAGAPGSTGPPSKPVPLVVPAIKPTVSTKPSVHAVAFVPGTSLLAISRYREVILVDVNTGFIERRLRGHAGKVTSLQVTADGKRLIAGGGEPGSFGEVKLWNVADGKLVRTFTGHGDSLYSVRFSPDAKLLATAGYDKEIHLWNVETGEPVRVMTGHNDAIYSLDFRTDGAILASASGDHTVKLWNVQTGARLDTFVQPLKEVHAVAFRPGGGQVAAAGVDNRVRVWSVSATGKEGTNPIELSKFAHQMPILALAFSPDGKRWASSAEDGTVKIWSSESYQEEHLLEPQPDWPAALAFSPDSATLAVGRHDGTLALYTVASGSKLKDLAPAPKPPPKPELLALTPRGIERGRSARVAILGKHLARASEVKVGHPGVSATLVPIADAGQRGGQLAIDLKAADDVPRGSFDVTVTTPGGTSNAVKLHVDDLPQFESASLASAPPTLPASLWGTLSVPGKSDVIPLDLRGGQTLVFDLAATSLGSKLSAAIALENDQGKVLGSAYVSTEGDPLLAFDVPADGRYRVVVSDVQFTGSGEHFYRLSVGAFPYVTGVFPLTVGANRETPIELVGYNLKGARVPVKAGAEGQVNVPVDPVQYRARKPWNVKVEALPARVESEPNDAPSQAQAVVVPVVIAGRILPSAAGTSDADLYRFAAKAGESWIIETQASRLGSPIDTRVEVLDATGKPVDRLLLQATRDSYVTFRGIDSNTVDLRVKNWEEMELNEFMYLQGEVCKIFRMPEGPDSGFNFYASAGRRRCYFDTSATTHALEDACYIVQPFPPGTPLVPNGLPVFTLTYLNDDGGERNIGRDSRLTFTAPADGEYLVRVTDVRGRSSDRHAYALQIRPPKPDFAVRVGNANPVVNLGSGREIAFEADRFDGFDGDIAISIDGLPPGFSITSPITIQAGHQRASTVLVADPSAKAPEESVASASTVSAVARIGGASVARSAGSLGKIQLGPAPKMKVRLEPAEVTIEPGSQVAIKLVIERNGFDDRVNFDVNNLPHGVIVDNIGLNKILIPKGESERTLFLDARRWVPSLSRTFHAVSLATQDASLPATLHVRAPQQVAEAK